MFMNRWPYTTLRGIVQKPMGSPRVGSNPTGVDSIKQKHDNRSTPVLTLVKVPGSMAQWGKNSGLRNLANSKNPKLLPGEPKNSKIGWVPAQGGGGVSKPKHQSSVVGVAQRDGCAFARNAANPSPPPPAPTPLGV